MQGGGRPIDEVWRSSNVHGKIRLVAIAVLWLWSGFIMLRPLPHALEKLQLNIKDPPAANNLIKEPAQKQGIRCPVSHMVLAPKGELLLLFNNEDFGRDRRHDSGLVLVMEGGLPRYTLEFRVVCGFDLWFDDDGLMCIEDGRGYGIKRYSIEGVHEASQDGNRGKAVNRTYWDRLTTPDGVQYELYREPNHQWVVMTDRTGTRRMIYEVKPEAFAKGKLQKGFFWMLLLVIFLEEPACFVIRKCAKMVKDDWAYSQEVKARIEKEKKSGKSIWR